MAISMYLTSISINFLSKQTNNSDQSAMVSWPIVPHLASWK